MRYKRPNLHDFYKQNRNTQHEMTKGVSLQYRQIAQSNYTKPIQNSSKTEDNKTKAFALNNRANTVLKQKKITEAISNYKECISLCPDIDFFYTNLGVALYLQEQFIEALQYFERSLILNPHNATLYNYKGNALSELKRHQEAVLAYSKAVDLKSDYLDAIVNLAIALRYLSKYSESVKWFDLALKHTDDEFTKVKRAEVVLLNERMQQSKNSEKHL